MTKAQLEKSLSDAHCCLAITLSRCGEDIIRVRARVKRYPDTFLFEEQLSDAVIAKSNWKYRLTLCLTNPADMAAVRRSAAGMVRATLEAKRANRRKDAHRLAA